MGNANIIKDYYAAWAHKDWKALEALLADDFAFSSPNHDDHIDKDAYKKKCWVGVETIDRYGIESITEQGDEAFARVRSWRKDGTTFRTAEYFRLKDGKIKEIDGFWGFMPQDILSVEGALQDSGNTHEEVS